MLIEAGQPATYGGDHPRLVFVEGEKAKGAWAGRRLLALDDKPAFELSLWCGTCPYLFERLEGATQRLSVDELRDTLRAGLSQLSVQVITSFDAILASGRYLPLLLEVQPRLVQPVTSGDYFSEEQVSTWGVDAFWGLPQYPRTPYYRTFETRVSGEDHLYEFVVPMVPPSWNETAQVAEYEAVLAQGTTPTAIAVSSLDICAPADGDESKDSYRHWGLAHFLLDGHHKMQAAAQTGRPLQLLSLLSLDSSLATPEELAAMPRLRAQQAASRPKREP